MSIYTHKKIHYQLRRRGGNTFGSVRVSVRLSVVLSCLNRLTFELDFWHDGRH